jgi:Kef-type K+ transport system membrane component KefB
VRGLEQEATTVKQSLDLNRGALSTLTLYGAMIAGTVALFLWLSSLGASLMVSAATPVELLARSAPREHGADLFHVLLALLLVLIASRVLGSLFRFVNQPPVIGEVVAGLLLGPSFLGRFAPGLAAYVLPGDIAPYLGILAQIGVVLYMFLVGLEFDTKLLRTSAHASLAISHASIVAPFLLGTAAALWLYPTFAGAGVSFVVFAMFSGLSLSVTAFPVLARIVTDCGLQNNRLGTIALGCAAIDDVTAWCLLALMEGVARARTGAAFSTIGLTLLYVAVVFGLVRPIVRRVCARQSEHGQVSPTLVAVSLVALLTSALVTELIGIHALFGAFLLGAVVPHDSVLAKDLARRIKDLVVVLLLPAFFAFTGMRTKLGLIDGLDGWLVCGLIVVIACVGKIGGSAVAARLSGLGWRDAAGLGVLMNTRGLMELIVLNIGLELKIISPALFAMLVVMAVVTTMATSPLLRLLLGVSPAPAPAPSSERALAG